MRVNLLEKWSPWFSELSVRTVILVVAALSLSIGVYEQIPAILVFVAHNLLAIAPMIVIGICLTAGVNATGSMAIIAAAFTGKEVRMLVVASFVGALTPVCGVSVLPLVAGLLAARVPFAPVMAFWLSSPITDPGMLAITSGTLGLTFAVGKTLAAFFSGVLGGLITLVLARTGYLSDPVREYSSLSRFTTSCCGNSEMRWMFWKEPERLKIFFESALASGKLMLIWLSVAFVAEYFLVAYLPSEWIEGLLGADNQWAVPLAALVGMPIYLDGYAALPFVRGLIDSGMGQGAAMAFLIAGGITSTWAAIPVYALVRLPTFILYLLLAFWSALLSGWVFGWFRTAGIIGV